jgi:hypothetical protein
MIPVVWWNKERGSWSCANVINEIFDLYGCEHYGLTYRDRLFPIGNPSSGGAICVLHAEKAQQMGQGEAVARLINESVQDMRWVIHVVIGDETGTFPAHLFSHPNMRVWFQAPLPTTKADRYLIQGYPANTKRDMNIERDLDYFFSGQVTHQRRRDCYDAMIKYQKEKTGGDGGVVLSTDGFGKGMDHRHYLCYLSSARMSPCPAGPQTPDTFRVYEALECGAIPILDAVSLRPETRGVWPLLLGDHPLPVIEDWATLPDVMAEWLKDWEDKARWIQMWWRSYKKDMQLWLAKDLISLGALDGREKEASAGITQAT